MGFALIRYAVFGIGGMFSKHMTRGIILFLVLMAAWLLLSGHYTSLLISFGVASVAFCVWMSHRMNAIDDEGLPLHLMARLPVYWVWLIYQIFLSNIQTVKIILTGKFEPRLFHIKTGEMSEAAIVLYANSITLTPGTVTVDITKDGFLVHALTTAMADDVKSDDMGKKVRQVDGAES